MAFSFFHWEALERVKDGLTEAQWDSVRAVAIIGGLALVGAGGYWGGHPALAHWQSRQALAQSRAFAAKKDYPSMYLALRRATQLAPRDRFVWEETARELSEVGSPEELTAREELTRLSPGDHGVQLALAQDALRYGRYDTAKSALDVLSAAGKTDVAYQRVAVALAVAQGKPDQLVVELKKLIELDPKNNNARFTYAAIQIWGTNPLEAQAARAELNRLLTDREVRIRAMIELIGEAARHGTPAQFNQVVLRGLAIFAPTVPLASLHTEVEAWETLLRGLKAAAPPSPTDTGLLARWIADMHRRPEALAWLRGLPDSLRNSPPVLDLTAQLAAEEKDDSVLSAALAAGAWGNWPDEAWKRAIANRRLVDHLDLTAQPVTWASALAACGDSLEGMRNLARLAVAWHQPKDAETAWLALLDHAPTVRWAYQALQSSYLSRQDFLSLLSLYNRWAAQFPLEDALAEQWILLAAELDHVTAAITARAEVLAANDTPALLAKVAVNWRRGRAWDSEKLLETLSPADRAAPDASFWIALIESDLNHREAAAAALKIAFQFPRTKVEDDLLQTAAQRVRYRPAKA